MPPRPHLFLLLALAAAAVLSACAGSFNAYLVDVAEDVGIAIILAVSLNLVNGYTGQFSLGHAGFMAVGAYASSWLTLWLGGRHPALFSGDTYSLQAHAVFLSALLLGGLCAAFAGLLVGVPSLRLKGDYLALVTLGFGEIIRVLIQNIEPLGGALGLFGMPGISNLFWVYSFAALAVFVTWSLVHSTYGRGFLATHDDEIAAEAIGLDTTRYKITAFVVGAFFAGIAGGLYAHFKLAIDPRGFDFTKSIEIVVMVILGGMGNMVGVILAAILLTVLPEFLRPIEEYRIVLYSLLLIGLMLVRPQGLFSFKPRSTRS